MSPSASDFSLLGGPVHRLGSRLGLVRGVTNTFPLGVAIAICLWAVQVALSVAGGRSAELFSVADLGVHVRLLVVIPLAFLCEALLDPRMAQFVRPLVASGLVPKSAEPELEAVKARTLRWKDSWLPDALCLVAAILVHVAFPRTLMTLSRSSAMTGWWYWSVCIPLIHFLMFRWLFRLGLWWHFLWRLSRLPLRLVPSHPDRVAGLGYLEVVHAHFVPMVMAISTTQAASLAEDLSGGMPFESIFPTLAATLVAATLLFLAPLFLFSGKLWACRVQGLSDYMVFASRYVDAFEDGWLRREAPPPARELLGTSDIQSLADLGNSVSVVRGMRTVPVSPLLLVQITASAIVPMLPLFLFKYPAMELVQKFFTRLSGL